MSNRNTKQYTQKHITPIFLYVYGLHLYASIAIIRRDSTNAIKNHR